MGRRVAGVPVVVSAASGSPVPTGRRVRAVVSGASGSPVPMGRRVAGVPVVVSAASGNPALTGRRVRAVVSGASGSPVPMGRREAGSAGGGERREWKPRTDGPPRGGSTGGGERRQWKPRTDGPPRGADRRGGPPRGGSAGGGRPAGPRGDRPQRVSDRPMPTERDLQRRAEKSLLPPEDARPRRLDREVRGAAVAVEGDRRCRRGAPRSPPASHGRASRAGRCTRVRRTERTRAQIAVVREAVGIAAATPGGWRERSMSRAPARPHVRRRGAIVARADANGRSDVRSGRLSWPRCKEAQTLDLRRAMRAAAGRRAVPAATSASSTRPYSCSRCRELEHPRVEPWLPRLRYAYADALIDADRAEDGRRWFALAAEADEDGETDAAERVLVMDGVVLEEAEPYSEDELAELAESGDDGAEDDPADVTDVGVEVTHNDEDLAAGEDDAGRDEEEASE